MVCKQAVVQKVITWYVSTATGRSITLFGNTNFKAIEYACSSKPGKEAHIQSWMNCNRTLFNPALIQAKPGKRGPLKIHEWPHPVRGHCLHDEIMYTYVMMFSIKGGNKPCSVSLIPSRLLSLFLSKLCISNKNSKTKPFCVFRERERAVNCET